MKSRDRHTLQLGFLLLQLGLQIGQCRLCMLQRLVGAVSFSFQFSTFSFLLAGEMQSGVERFCQSTAERTPIVGLHRSLSCWCSRFSW